MPHSSFHIKRMLSDSRGSDCVWGWGGGGIGLPTLCPGTAVLKWPLPLPAVHRYLSYTLNPDYIRKQDATNTIINIANNVAGQSLVWDFVRSNWKKLFEE